MVYTIWFRFDLIRFLCRRGRNVGEWVVRMVQKARHGVRLRDALSASWSHRPANKKNHSKNLAAARSCFFYTRRNFCFKIASNQTGIRLYFIILRLICNQTEFHLDPKQFVNCFGNVNTIVNCEYNLIPDISSRIRSRFFCVYILIRSPTVPTG